MTVVLQPGKLVSVRGREWVVLPSDEKNLLLIRPLGGSEAETTGIYLPLNIPSDQPQDAFFPKPNSDDLGNFNSARLLYDAARLAFRNGAGPFRALAKLSFRPRAYQIVPLVMALKQEVVRLLIADDVGVGKTIEALLVMREMMERAKVKRFAVICLPHLCDQWQEEIRSKLGIEAVIIRSNTQARLDRQIQGDTSVYDFYPYQIISVDYIKADNRRDVFIEQCPRLVIVDEAHSCTKPAGASKGQQQRYHLLSDLAAKKNQHLVMLTATPHSGKPEEFHSLLGLLKPEFETIDIPTAGRTERQNLAKHFVQRKRGDVAKWMGEKTPFPDRETIEWNYDLSQNYLNLFNDVVQFGRKLISASTSKSRVKKVHYWTALGLMRGVMSSPGAGIKMLATRLDKVATSSTQDDSAVSEVEMTLLNPVGDQEDGFDPDNAPTQIMDHGEWTDYQKKQLRELSDRLSKLTGVKHDQKLYAASLVVEDWLKQGLHPVIFCRYIETANYLGEYLAPVLSERFSGLDLQVITSELPDDLRKQRISEMEGSKRRVIVATDCLSEGINLQELFTAVLHYDLPWNPNRLEQREGRVDRYGQQAKEVRTCLLYGSDNPIDGIVLDVLLRKVREIKRDTGISIPFPEDSQSVIDTITQALLLNPDRKIQTTVDQNQQVLFDYSDFGEAAAMKQSVTRKIDEAAEREKASRSIFAQHAIKAQEIEEDLRVMDEAIGDPAAVQDFVTATLPNVFGTQVTKETAGFGIIKDNLPPQLMDLLPEPNPVLISFQSPTPEGYHYLGRNHPFVEQLCQLLMANSVARDGKRAARASVIRSRSVKLKTTLLLFRCRNVIENQKEKHQIVAEEMLLWGWSGTPSERVYLDHEAAKNLLVTAKASSDMTNPSRKSFLDNELKLLRNLDPEFDGIAEEQSKRLVAAHERFSALMDKQRYQVVYPVLPMDLMGIYVLLPEGPQ